MAGGMARCRYRRGAAAGRRPSSRRRRARILLGSDVSPAEKGQDGAMIEAQHLTKRYGPTMAVDHLPFTVQPGVVTGFLGPNGAGKSTTMRLILGLDAPS